MLSVFYSLSKLLVLLARTGLKRMVPGNKNEENTAITILDNLELFDEKFSENSLKLRVTGMA